MAYTHFQIILISFLSSKRAMVPKTIPAGSGTNHSGRLQPDAQVCIAENGSPLPGHSPGYKILPYHRAEFYRLFFCISAASARAAGRSIQMEKGQHYDSCHCHNSRPDSLAILRRRENGMPHWSSSRTSRAAHLRLAQEPRQLASVRSLLLFPAKHSLRRKTPRNDKSGVCLYTLKGCAFNAHPFRSAAARLRARTLLGQLIGRPCRPVQLIKVTSLPFCAMRFRFGRPLSVAG